MLSEQMAEISERMRKTGIGLKETLSVIEMAFEGQTAPIHELSPYEVFGALNKLIDSTVHGATVERFRPKDNRKPFHTLEIRAEEGDVLGYLNMMYLNKFIPCYYLVYVEIMPSFRGLGLGYKILKAFMEFVKNKNAVGLLDNIIPPEDPTFEIYTRLGWKAMKDYIRRNTDDGCENYMVFVPDSVPSHAQRDNLARLLFTLRKKRPIIDMHDNEDMVKRTITEFRSVYQVLTQLFETELSSNRSNPLMRFMFTRMTTKLIGFRRRIEALIGYTGGESLEQLSISAGVKELLIQPYSLWDTRKGQERISGDEALLKNLPQELTKEPTLFIEGLPLYRRPYLRSWLEKKRMGQDQQLKISDLLDLGFDPTKLREFRHEGEVYIFERIPPRFYPSVMNREESLRQISRYASKRRFCGAALQINPPVVILRDRGNVYVLRRKVPGIHSHEALDQLRSSPYLKEMNRAAGLDRVISRTLYEVKDWLGMKFNSGLQQEIEELTYFVPWNLENDIPTIHVDASGASLDTLWIA